MKNKQLMIDRQAFISDMQEVLKKHGASLYCSNWDILDEAAVDVYFHGPNNEQGYSWSVDVQTLES